MAEDFFSKHDNDLLVSLRKAASEYEKEQQEKATDKEEKVSKGKPEVVEKPKKTGRKPKDKNLSAADIDETDDRLSIRLQFTLSPELLVMFNWLKMLNNYKKKRGSREASSLLVCTDIDILSCLKTGDSWVTNVPCED